MFCATGAAVATSPKTQSVAFGQNSAGLTSPQPTTADAAAMRARHLKEIDSAKAVALANHTKAVARELAVARTTAVTRSVQRKKLAARAVEVKHAALAHSWRLPVTHPVVSSGFGYRWGRLHAGQDFAVSEGTPLASMSTGTVTFAGVMGGYGNLVKIRYWDGTISFYGHMSRISVNSGDSVQPGQSVGKSGNTGHSTGPHLHLEIHPNGGQPVDPASWLARRSVGL
jgi:murein DD-endopeptidase MepM/ murein hydrolase activator NlpD